VCVPVCIHTCTLSPTGFCSCGSDNNDVA
jgi:hypothetical protein